MKTYKQKSSAVRAARKELGKQAQPYVDFELVLEKNGEWSWEHGEATFEEGNARKEMTYKEDGSPVPVDEVPVVGEFSHCPGCGVHLDNGYDTYNNQVEDKRPTNEKYEFVCLACEHEFGSAIKPVAKKQPSKATGQGPKQVNKSTAKKPCSIVWEICEANKDKGLKRKDILQLCVDAGVAYYTARTQYQQWLVASRGETK